MKRTPERAAAGFTLLELILAVGISLVLLYAVYRATAMHFVQLESGREIAEHAQLVRSLAAVIQHDLRMAHMVYEPVASAASEEAQVIMVSDYEVPAGGVLGYEDAISLVVRVPPRDLDFAMTGDAQTPLDDLRMIRYRLGSIDDSDGPIGLIREEVFRMPDPEFNADPVDYSVQSMLAEEVRGIEFAYFDGTEWVSEWDSLNESAPSAVEVILAVALPQVGASQFDDESVGEGEERVRAYRIVVALPKVTASEPIERTSSSSGGEGGSGSGGSQSQSGGAP